MVQRKIFGKQAPSPTWILSSIFQVQRIYLWEIQSFSLSFSRQKWTTRKQNQNCTKNSFESILRWKKWLLLFLALIGQIWGSYCFTNEQVYQADEETLWNIFWVTSSISLRLSSTIWEILRPGRTSIAPAMIFRRVWFVCIAMLSRWFRKRKLEISSFRTKSDLWEGES